MLFIIRPISSSSSNNLTVIMISIIIISGSIVLLVALLLPSMLFLSSQSYYYLLVQCRHARVKKKTKKKIQICVVLFLWFVSLMSLRITEKMKQNFSTIN